MSNPLHAQESGELNVDSLVAATGGNDDTNRNSEYSGHHSFSVGKLLSIFIFSYLPKKLFIQFSLTHSLPYSLTYSFIYLRSKKRRRYATNIKLNSTSKSA